MMQELTMKSHCSICLCDRMGTMIDHNQDLTDGVLTSHTVVRMECGHIMDMTMKTYRETRDIIKR